MSGPIAIDIPHKLGKDLARSRIDGGIGRLASFIPGASVTEHRWEGDTMIVAIEAMGQRVASRMTVADSVVHAEFDLPLMLQPFAAMLRDKMTKEGTKLLR